MKSTFARLATFLSVLTLTASAAFADSGWDSNYAKALTKAKTEKKMVLLDFTGSDWCGWCIKLDKEVFSKQQFKDYAKANLVLVEVDFPHNKKQNKSLVTQNEKLKTEFSIQGFPTIIVLDQDGKKIGQLGYMQGGPESFVAALERLKPKQ